MEEREEGEELKLRRFEFLDDEHTQVDWMWLTDKECIEHIEKRGEAGPLIYRDASAEEQELYDEAYNDGYMIATVTNNNDNYNGILFRMDGLGEDGNIVTTKIFECAICGETKDFKEEVAMANGFYISVEKDDILWHVCYDCTTLEVQFNMSEDE